ncbi:MAG: dATP/dGTP diphosphohydrolase domain-containing protein [Promethearchaeota archaeon]
MKEKQKKVKCYNLEHGDLYNEGFKYDDGKLRYDLIPPEVLKSLAEVLTYGSQKYGDNTWQGVKSERYYAALFRHLQAWRMGKENDSESKIHHLKHALCNIAFILCKDLTKTTTEKLLEEALK